MKKLSYSKLVPFIIIAAIVMSWFGNVVSLSGELVPVITVIPGMNVDVGEAVLFSGENTIYADQSALEKARFEWDFGDGYYLKYGYPDSKSTYSGMSAVHHYMSPGTYEVTMTVYLYGSFSSDGTPTGDPVLEESTSVVIYVEGSAPMEGFEMLHAPFESRLAQFITVIIPETVYSDSTNRLTVTLEGSNYEACILLDKTGLQEEEKFLLEQRDLPAGDYQILAELKDSAGNVLSQWKEKFTKACEGIPEVGINEWNAICINGDPTFITSAYTLHSGRFNLYTTEFSTLYQMGYYGSGYTPATWLSYINSAASKGWLAIGPGRGTHIDNRHYRNASLAEIGNYVYSAKNHDSMLIWDWSYNHYSGAEIPKRVAPPVLAAWTYITKNEDPQHPVMTALDGLKYLPYYSSSAPSVYDYSNSTAFGEKRYFYADILMMKALHPLNDRMHKALFNKDRGVIDLWLQSIKNFQDMNYNLIPVAVNLEVAQTSANVPAPTHEQVLMEAWLAAINGVKMIDWQVSNSVPNQVGAMKKFTAAMATFDDIILGPDVPDSIRITDNSNERYNRVDTLTRQDGEFTYLFAVRLTEPDPLPEETNHLPEPESITTTFMVPGIESGWVDVLDEHGIMTGDVLTIEDGEFQDTLEKYAVRIYRISKEEQNENYPPILAPIGNKTAQTGIILSFTVSATDPEGQELEYSATNLPDGATFNSGSGVFSWTPVSGQEGEYNITFAVTDGVNTVEETITIEVIAAGPVYYVRAGAAGANNGSSWADAWTELPYHMAGSRKSSNGDLERGATYYIADGVYPPYVFDSALDGEKIITIKKATIEDHGTDTGWDDSYGDGVALFTSSEPASIFEFKTGYYTIDGQTGSFDTGHGIHLYNQHDLAPHSGGSAVFIQNGANVSHLTLRHLNIEGSGWGRQSSTRLMYFAGNTDHFVMQHCYVHETCQEWLIQTDCGNYTLIEHCYFQNAGSGTNSLHSVGLWIRSKNEETDVIIRNNIFENVMKIGGTGYITLGYAETVNSGFKIYGNVFFESSELAGPSRLIGSNGSGVIPAIVRNVKFYNNTIFRVSGNACNIAFLYGDGAGNEAVNNLWVECDKNPSFTNIAASNNVFNSVSSNVFVDTLSRDFRLAAANSILSAGITLSDEFACDPLGNVRGADGYWDIGAYEYSETASNPD